MPGELRLQGAPAGGVDVAHLADVPVEPAGFDHHRESELVQRRYAATGQQLLPGERPEQRWRREQPADPQAGRQGLAHRAERHDPAGRQALQ
ncbi:hypothetical protein [Sphaerisporangium rufum]|uniref:hypothetical protein n=1 Tax=Sphaerisporangium rufum TaxID=1381558 RepID=UPI00194F3788|nr:hypothetical protein [Sphaerisporangium rufum]